MASISNRNGLRTVQFVGVDGKRRSIRLGKVSKQDAERIRLRVEALLNAKATSSPLDRETTNWLQGIGDVLYAKLVAVGLIERRLSATLGDFTRSYIDSKGGIKKATKVSIEQARSRLLAFFPSDKPLASITTGDCDRWVDYLKGRFAAATVGATIIKARSVFKSAVRHKLIAENPLGDVKAPAEVNVKRRFLVSPEWSKQILESCPDAEWRLIFGLARWGGLRIPSELVGLTWDDILWDKKRFRILSPKTEAYEGKHERYCPIFPELEPLFREAFEAAPDGAIFVIPRVAKNPEVNLGRMMAKIIHRAGLKVWPKLFVNMRSTRQTELTNAHPSHVVTSWLGNSVAVANTHYLQTTEEHFVSAVRDPETDRKAVQNPVQSVLQAVQNPVQPNEDTGCQPSGVLSQLLSDSELRQVLATLAEDLHRRAVASEGIEPSSSACKADVVGPLDHEASRDLHHQRAVAQMGVEPTNIRL